MKRRPINWLKIRIFAICCLLLLCFGLIMVRMFQLQVLKKEQLYKLAAQQQHVTIPLVPKRGTIYDQKGNDLAVSVEVDSVYADPQKVTDVGKTAGSLAAILKLNQEELRRKLRSDSSFEWIQRKIPPEQTEEIKALHLPGVAFIKENKRFYPNAHLAAHVIGFLGLDSKGLEGIEVQYDAVLNGNKNAWMMGRDALGREIAVGEIPFHQEEHFRNVILTLDKHIQHVVETELSRSVQKWGAKGGFVIAMDPLTGKILALANHPSFNPNQFLQYRPRVWRNRAVSDLFEPGSMFKVFLAATALEEKVTRVTDSYFCENGAYTVYDRTIHDHSKHGWLNFREIIKVSSNIGASKVGEKIGKERFYRYISAFGFGEKTGIGLPGEGKGIVHHPRYWPPIAVDTVSFGQGISVTGIQLAAGLSAIANGGHLIKPMIVERITNEKGEVVQSFQPQMMRRVIAEESAKQVAVLLKGTTEKGGTGEEAVPAGYEVAGKTGTAQKVDSLLGGYSEDRFTSGFMGFAPASQPRLVLVVVIDEPQGNNYGGIVAAPVFKAILEKVLPYLNVHPKGTLIVKNESDVSHEVKESPKEISARETRAGSIPEKGVMPDLTGLSKRNAISRIEGKGLIIKVSGNGKVVDQIPKPGVMIEKGDICYLKFHSSS